jgi:CheY-like chemotaxis protein
VQLSDITGNAQRVGEQGGNTYAALAAAAGAAAVLEKIVTTELAVRLVPEKLARRHFVVPLAVDNRMLTYATCLPFSADADRDLGFASGRRTTAVTATRTAVVEALDRCYPKLSDLDVLAQRLRATGANETQTAKEAESAAIEMCNQIVGRATQVGATEVHLACGNHGGVLRYRIGGVFESELKLPTAMSDAIRDRFKIMARVGMAVRNRAQTGSFRLTLNGQPTAANLATQPTYAGETIVIQLAGQRATAPPVVLPETGGRSRVLIADDEPITRMLVKLLLERENYEVLEAKNGDEAVTIATRERPALLLLDLNMPIMDGYEAIHHLRRDSSLTTLPIIVLTGEDGPAVERRVLAMGADDYMIKPFEAPILLSRVHAVFSRLKLRAA